MSARRPRLLRPVVSYDHVRIPGTLFLPVIFDGLKGRPVEAMELTVDETLRLIEQLSTGLRELAQADERRGGTR